MIEPLNANPWTRPLPAARVAATLAAGLLAAILLGGGAAYIATTALWARAIAPFDPRPEIGFWQLLEDPASVPTYWRAQCTWLNREVLRNPSPMVKVARTQACQAAERP
jgi:hypothetical protein